VSAAGPKKAIDSRAVGGKKDPGDTIRTSTFALFIGFAYLSLGLLGLVPGTLEPPPADAPEITVTTLHGYLFGVFAVNVLHSIVHAAIGAVGLFTWRSDHLGNGLRAPKLFARGLATLTGALALLGVTPSMNSLFGLVPLHGHDVWLHAATAALAAYFGWRTESEVNRRAGRETDRRQTTLPVEKDRRLGHADRRVPGSEV
jgi:hypothetical protein